MIQAKIPDTITTLDEWYEEVKAQQRAAHGPDFCAHHDAIISALTEMKCKSYKELGTHQGATAAAALLCKPRSVVLVDRSLELYKKSKKIFDDYATDHNIRLQILESDSTRKETVSNADVLLIDSKHTYGHITKELKLHHYSINKYIIAHDTASKPELHRALLEFCEKTDEWKILRYYTSNVGYTMLKRHKRYTILERKEKGIVI